jgi:hypothetical protein
LQYQASLFPALAGCSSTSAPHEFLDHTTFP